MMSHSLRILIVGLVWAGPVAAAEPSLTKTDLFEADRGGYAIYRIPCLAVTPKGTLLAWCEARKSARSDWGTIDLLMRRSTDGGKTWSEPRKVAEVEGPHKKNPVALAQKLGNPDDVTYNNPAVIVDSRGGVHFLFCLEYMRCFYTRSEDDGQTFSKPVEITPAFEKFRKVYDWKVLATGPGHGIQLQTGKLLVPVWLSTGTGGHAHRPSVVTVLVSGDGGKNWRLGEVAAQEKEPLVNPSETTAVQLADGRVMLNIRSEAKPNRRGVSFSKDGETGWSRPAFDDGLPEPICMGCLCRLSLAKTGGKDRLLFVNPNNLEKGSGQGQPGQSRDRKNLTVRLSYDEGKSWEVSRALEPGPSAYSDLAVAPDGWIYCLYERGEGEKGSAYRRLTLAKFNLEWLSDGKDSLKR